MKQIMTAISIMLSIVLLFNNSLNIFLGIIIGIAGTITLFLEFRSERKNKKEMDLLKSENKKIREAFNKNVELHNEGQIDYLSEFKITENEPD